MCILSILILIHTHLHLFTVEGDSLPLWCSLLDEQKMCEFLTIDFEQELFCPQQGGLQWTGWRLNHTAFDILWRLPKHSTIILWFLCAAWAFLHALATLVIASSIHRTLLYTGTVYDLRAWIAHQWNVTFLSYQTEYSAACSVWGWCVFRTRLCIGSFCLRSSALVSHLADKLSTPPLNPSQCSHEVRVQWFIHWVLWARFY